MIETQQLIVYLNSLLENHLFSDYCPNGLQVAGKPTISKIISGVSASQALLDAAVAAKADAVLVHHGYFWKGEDPCLTGIKRERIATLLNANINLIAYHLPLDAHETFGNNVQIAHHLEIDIDKEFIFEKGVALSRLGHLRTSSSGEQFVKFLESKLSRKPLYIPGKSKSIHSIAWCTGAAQDYIQQAVDEGVDAYLTGEVSERTVLMARETGIHFFAAGHHATERYGVAALGDHLADEYDIEHEFIDIDNPV